MGRRVPRHCAYCAGIVITGFAASSERSASENRIMMNDSARFELQVAIAHVVVALAVTTATKASSGSSSADEAAECRNPSQARPPDRAIARPSAMSCAGTSTKSAMTCSTRRSDRPRTAICFGWVANSPPTSSNSVASGSRPSSSRTRRLRRAVLVRRARIAERDDHGWVRRPDRPASAIPTAPCAALRAAAAHFEETRDRPLARPPGRQSTLRRPLMELTPIMQHGVCGKPGFEGLKDRHAA